MLTVTPSPVDWTNLGVVQWYEVKVLCWKVRFLGLPFNGEVVSNAFHDGRPPDSQGIQNEDTGPAHHHTVTHTPSHCHTHTLSLTHTHTHTHTHTVTSN